MVQAKCVVIGGGTGSFNVLSGLKGAVSDIAALVSMADDGGSTGLLRDDMGVLPPGDVRKCLVALSDAPQELRNLFNYRYAEGTFQGHTFGNLFLSTVEKMTSDFAEAVRIAGDILRIHGRVIPITLSNVHLVISWEDGTTVRGESTIDDMQFVRSKGRPTLTLAPKAVLNPMAREAILQADIVIIAPGDLYTSLGALLAVEGVGKTLAQTKGRLIYVSNLVTKPGHTEGFTVSDHAAEIERFLGGPRLDYVIYNEASLPAVLIEKYMRQGELPVRVDSEVLAAAHYQAVGADLVAAEAGPKQKGDPLQATRSYIRHDGAALAAVIEQLL